MISMILLMISLIVMMMSRVLFSSQAYYTTLYITSQSVVFPVTDNALDEELTSTQQNIIIIIIIINHHHLHHHHNHHNHHIIHQYQSYSSPQISFHLSLCGRNYTMKDLPGNLLTVRSTYSAVLCQKCMSLLQVMVKNVTIASFIFR